MRFREWLRQLGTAGPRKVALAVVPVVAVWLVLVVSGLRGLDYGYHWDETSWQVKPVRNAIAKKRLLPRSYIYPTFAKWLVAAPAAVVGLETAVTTGFNSERTKDAMLAAVDAPKYLVTVRRLFTLACSLSIFWIYGAGLSFRLPRWAALAGAAAFGLSWEFAYHARYIATDCLLTQWVACVLFMLARYDRTQHIGYLRAASVAAGLATGTKYTGVFVLLPVVLAGALTLPHRPLRALVPQVKRASLSCGLALVVYLVTTPGTLVDTRAFIKDSQWISQAYATGHGGYTAHGAWHHARLAFEYLALAYFSPYKILAVLAFAGALVGAAWWVRAEPRVAAVLLICPVVFLVFFCATFRVVIVRNYLFLAPFLALFLARALAEGAARLHSLPLRVAGGVALAAIGVLHAVWLVRAGESIRHVSPQAYVRQALEYVARHRDRSFRLSAQVARLARKDKLALPSNVAAAPSADAFVFFARDEGPGPRLWRTNDPFQALAVFGPLEVNFDWYASWMGHDRVVVMTRAKARATHVPFAL